MVHSGHGLPMMATVSPAAMRYSRASPHASAATRAASSRHVVSRQMPSSLARNATRSGRVPARSTSKPGNVLARSASKFMPGGLYRRGLSWGRHDTRGAGEGRRHEGRRARGRHRDGRSVPREGARGPSPGGHLAGRPQRRRRRRRRADRRGLALPRPPRDGDHWLRPARERGRPRDVRLHRGHALTSRDPGAVAARPRRSEEHASELQSQSHISYAVFCLKKKKQKKIKPNQNRNKKKKKKK